MLNSLIEAFFALVVTSLFLLILFPVASKVGLLDRPSLRKQHADNPALIGGVAIWLGVLVCLYTWADLDSTTNYFLLATGLMVLVGVLDDRFGLPVVFRILVEIAVAFIMILLANLWVGNLGNLFGFGEVHLSLWVAYPFTVIAVFGVINALNMMDGIDGLAATMALTALVFLLVFAGNSPTLLTIGPALLGCLFAFLMFNLQLFNRFPKIFLGDAGSKFLGLTLVWVIIESAQSDLVYDAGINPATALYFIGLPLFDMVTTTLRRLHRRKAPFEPDRTHAHHLLGRIGFSHRSTLVILWLLSMLIICIGLLLNKFNVSEILQFLIILCLFGLYLVLIDAAWKKVEKASE